MLRWARVPAAVFVLAFGGSLAYLEVDEGGGGAAPRSAGDPARDGGRLVVTYSATVDNPDQGYLGTIAIDGSDLRKLIEPPGGDRAAVNASPSVAPGGDIAAFQRAMAGPSGGRPPHVYVIPLDGSRPEHRVTRGPAPEVDPTWSPDGERIAFARQVAAGFDLFACSADGSEPVRLTNTPGVDELSPAWSPDGTRIAFARYEDGLENGPGNIWLMSDHGGSERLLRGGDGHDYSAPAWSPDGRSIALLLDGHVAITDADGRAVRQLTADEELKETRPSWSPDGSRLTFTRDPGTILTMNADGSGARRLPFDGAATGVAWIAPP